MKLIMSTASPFVRKVRVLIRELGAEGDIEEINVATTPMDSAPEVVKANPLGRIPALIVNAEQSLYDSRVITRYLNDRYGGGFYPDDRLYDVLVREATAEGLLDSAVNSVYEKKFRSPEMQSPEWLAAQWAKIERALDQLGTTLPEQGQPLTMGDIAAGCALGYLDFRFPQRDWRGGRAELAEWFSDLSAREAFVATKPQ